MTESLALSVREAAELLGCPRSRVYEMVAQGHLKRVPHMGKRIYVARSAVLALVAEAEEVAS